MTISQRSFNDGTTTLDSATSISLPASLGTTGLSTRQVKTYILTGKATTAAPTLETSSDLEFAGIAGGKNLLNNGLFLVNVAGWTLTSCTTAFSSGKMVITPSGSNWGVSQALQSLCSNGKKYIAIAKYSGIASLTLGNAWDGSTGARPLSDSGFDGYWPDGDRMAMIAFTYQRNLAGNLSLGRVGGNTAVTVDFIVLIEA